MVHSLETIIILVTIGAILTDSAFIFLMFSKSKGLALSLKTGITLFLGILVIYLLSGAFGDFFQIWHLLMFNIVLFMFVKILFRKQIQVLDFLLIGYILYIFGIPNTLIVYLSLIEVISYPTAFIISRLVMLTILLVCYKHLNTTYGKIVNLWDRRDDGKIKAITVRNIALIGANVLIYIFYMVFAHLVY